MNFNFQCVHSISSIEFTCWRHIGPRSPFTVHSDFGVVRAYLLYDSLRLPVRELAKTTTAILNDTSNGAIIDPLYQFRIILSRTIETNRASEWSKRIISFNYYECRLSQTHRDVERFDARCVYLDHKYVSTTFVGNVCDEFGNNSFLSTQKRNSEKKETKQRSTGAVNWVWKPFDDKSNI